jgi:hypothetical protein
MRLTLIDYLVLVAVLAVLLVAARQEFPHFTPNSAPAGDAAQ